MANLHDRSCKRRGKLGAHYMNTSLDCIPCIIRQALEAARLVSTDAADHEKTLRAVLRWTGEMDLNLSPPFIAQRIHRFLRDLTNIQDPYRVAKDAQNRMALALFPDLKIQVANAADPLIMALRLALAGNNIDMGVFRDVNESMVQASIHQALTEPFAGDAEAFRSAVAQAGYILYLADNAGEIVFDRLLIEQLAPARVTVAVRGAPVINDATISDARTIGLCDVVEVIGNGSDAPGTLLDSCSPEFQRCFAQADLVIAKGQGNFETLSDFPGNIIFLFKAKCPVIANYAQVPLGAGVLRGPEVRGIHIGTSRGLVDTTIKELPIGRTGRSVQCQQPKDKADDGCSTWC